jgi:serine/threonine-protein kinase
MPRIILLVLSFTVALAWSEEAGAESATTTAAQAHFQRATSLYAEGRYEEALEAYRQAHELVPHPSALFNMARCHENMGDLPAALRRYREALELTDDETDRDDLARRIANIMARPVRVFITSDPAGASVLVDAAEAAEPAVTPTTVDLLPGPHRLILSAEGFQPAILRVVVVVGRNEPVNANLDPSRSADGRHHDERPEPCPSCRRIGYEGTNFNISLGLPTYFPVVGLHTDQFQSGAGVGVNALISIGHILVGGSAAFFPMGSELSEHQYQNTDTGRMVTVDINRHYYVFDLSLIGGYVWTWDIIAISAIGGLSVMIDLANTDVVDDALEDNLDFDGNLSYDNTQILGFAGTSVEFFVRPWFSFSIDVRLKLGAASCPDRGILQLPHLNASMTDPTAKTGKSAPLPTEEDELALAETAATPSEGLELGGDGPVSRISCEEARDRLQDPADPMIGHCLAGRYLIERRLGRGGMGMVYLARHQALGKAVAVKLIHSEMARNELNMARFEREARSAAALDHEHVVDVIDYGHTEDGLAFMVMEALEGRTVGEMIEEVGPLPAGRATAIAWQIAKGLRVAHEAGLIHRDLKSPNVFLVDREGRDHVKLLDFGISKILESDNEDDVKLTSTGVVMGTPNYLSPEQAKGEKDIDHRADIYALGVIFYEMLTGTLPFTGSNVLELAYKHISVEPEPPSAKRPDLNIPPELDRVVLRCLSKEPEARYQTAPELMAALPDPSNLSGGWTLISQLPSSSRELIVAGRAQRGWKRRIALALALGALVGGGVVAFYMFRHPPPPPRQGRDLGPPAVIVAASEPDTSPVDSDTRPEPAARLDASSEALPSKVRVSIRPDPASAAIYLNGELAGHGELSLELDRSGAPVEIMVKAAGYRAVTREVEPRENQSITVNLEHLRGGPSPLAGPATPGDDRPNPSVTTPSDVRGNPYGE